MRYAKIFLIIVCAAFLYIQVIIVKGFNTEEFAEGKVNLRPQSLPHFGGFHWGLLRFDLEDRLYVGVDARIGSNQDADISLEKDGKTLVVRCRSDQSGICYEAFHRDDMKMSGRFKLTVAQDKKQIRYYEGEFVRQSSPVIILKEVFSNA